MLLDRYIVRIYIVECEQLNNYLRQAEYERLDDYSRQVERERLDGCSRRAERERLLGTLHGYSWFITDDKHVEYAHDAR